ncbi:MAG TPA: C25 family cysteine peptidase [Candidatus Krumholzibacteria bacterium]|nr:C25 family cysteine peptidase [Candidatus Krumholzibacteria bacterium]
MTRCALVLLTLALLAPVTGFAAQDTLVLRDDAAAAGLRLLQDGKDRVTVVCEIPKLGRESMEVDGRTYTALTIPGGALLGDEGRPGLPTLGGLLELPHGRGVRVEVIAREETVLEGVTPLPVQPEDGAGFALAADYFTTPAAPELVSLGAPALLHGRRVAPFHIAPVRWDPDADAVIVTTRLELAFTFDGVDTRNDPAPDGRPLPASFARTVADHVLNPSMDKAGGETLLGAYLVICPDDAAVVAALQPLLDWRRRQGYTVMQATTAETGGSASSIKSFIKTTYDAVPVPLEFVTLVGDNVGAVVLPTWTETLSGYNGGGDHYYTTLAGDDVLPDIYLGRLSCRSVSELVGIVTKIVTYETAPPTADSGWFRRASLTADPSSSGTSTIHVSQWLKAQLQGIGFAQVDTFWSGSYATQMFNSLNQGVSIFSYRGYLGMSGFTSSYIDNTTNGGKLPFAIFPTCDSGSWASTVHARNEAFLRNANGGGIGAIGLATIGTHTRYNNCLYNGIGETVINGDDHRLGVAQAGGKLEMYRNYQAFEPDRVEIWSVWSSLIGDPATDVWLDEPKALTVDHPAALPVGAASIPVTVTSGGTPLAGVLVAVVKDGEISAHARTGDDGRALLPLAAHTAGSLLVTAWGHDLLPYQGAATLGSVDRFLEPTAVTVDDAAGGDGDGLLEPGETARLDVSLLNRGGLLAGAVTAALTADHSGVTVLDADDAFGDVAGGAVAAGAGGFQIQLAADAPGGADLGLVITAASGAETWVSPLPVSVDASDFELAATAWSAGGDPQPGQTGTLVLTLTNTGPAEGPGVSGTLSCTSPWITVTDDAGGFGAIAADADGRNLADPFGLTISTACPGGHLAAFRLDVTQTDGALRSLEFTLPVGTAAVTDPVGPDGYGYLAYDDTDDDPLLAPVYDWVEIDPNHGGAGTDVGLNDFGYEQDDTVVLDLPFTVSYYGRTFDQAAVCSNGWLAMGNTSFVHWRNWSIPSAGSPDAMIAPFWDDLRQAGTNRVYAWHDAANQRFIVQWSRMTNLAGGLQNFEVILHDPTAYPTPSGDAPILFQYETVTNNDTSRGYATTGIQNLDGTDGVLYTYYNAYAPGAAPLAAGRAILFHPGGNALASTCDAAPGSIGATLAPGESTTATLRLENNGDTGSVLLYHIEKTDPEPPTAGAKNLTGSSLTADLALYTPGSTVNIVLTAACVSFDQEWLLSIDADLPDGVTLNTASSFQAGNPLEYSGETGNGALMHWGDGIILDNQSAQAVINVSFTGATGTLEIPYTLNGDNWGEPPHQITGTIVLEQDGPSVRILAPNGGERWGEGEQNAVTFTALNGPTAVRLELDRGQGAGWELLADDVPAAAGESLWTVTAPYSAGCRVRVTDVNDPGLQDESDGTFTIGRSLGWLTLAATDGTLPAGQGVDIGLVLDAAGLAEGVHRIDLVVSNTSGTPLTVPVTLTVTTTTDVEPLPARLDLAPGFPNPFNPSTTLAFSLPAPAQVSLHVYDMQGRRVATLQQGELPAGRHARTWNGLDDRGRPVPSGMFVARLEVAGEVMTRKLVLTK